MAKHDYGSPDGKDINPETVTGKTVEIDDKQGDVHQLVSSGGGDLILQLGTGTDLMTWDKQNQNVEIPNGDLGIGGSPESEITTVRSGESNVWRAKNYRDSTFGISIEGQRARGTSGTPAVLNSEDDIMTINAMAYDGTQFLSAANIAFEADSPQGTNDVPGRITLNTTPDGSATPTAGLQVNRNQDVSIPNGNLTVSGSLNLGTQEITSVGTVRFNEGHPFFVDGSNNYKWRASDGVTDLLTLTNSGTLLLNAGVLRGTDGTPTNPGISFNSDTNTGLYLSGVDDLRVSAGASTKFAFDGTTNKSYQDLEFLDSNEGMILKAPNGTRYRVQVDNSGNLTTTAL